MQFKEEQPTRRKILIYITQCPVNLAPRRHVYGSAARVSSNHMSELLNSQSMSSQMGTPEDRAEALAAFELACSPYYEQVRRYCISNAKNISFAEDVAQEVIVKAFRSWHTFKDYGAGPWPWLKMIATNALKTAGQKYYDVENKREFVRQGEDGEVDFGYDKFDQSNWGDSPEFLVIEQLGMSEIESAINALDEEFRDVAWLKFVVGLDNIEIAEMLGIKQNTIGSRVSRARAKLHESLKDIAAGYGIGLDKDKKK
jgi:RNA polymerase sigma-70 factor (ECF subfamily)